MAVINAPDALSKLTMAIDSNQSELDHELSSVPEEVRQEIQSLQNQEDADNEKEEAESLEALIKGASELAQQSLTKRTLEEYKKYVLRI